MIKQLFIKAVLFVSLLFFGFVMGYYYSKSEVINKALADKKDCYDLYDIYLITK